MYFHWGFPLLVVPFLSNSGDTNFSLSIVIAFLCTVLGIMVLASNAFSLHSYEKFGAQLGFGFLGVALLMTIFGFLPVVIVIIAVAVLYFFIWRMLIRNFLALFGKEHY